MQPSSPTVPRISLRFEVLLCAAGGIAMGGAYDIQSVIPEVADALGLSLSQAGLFPALTQLGLWVGVLALLPLGDLLDGRRLVVSVLLANVVALCLSALSTGSGPLALASFLVGATTVAPYLLPPLASRLVSPEQRSEVIARMTAATFAGIVISRAASVYLAEKLGWSAPFWLSAAMCVLIAVALRRALPSLPATPTLRYSELIASLGRLLRSQRPLREATATQGLQFAAFNLFWIVLPMFLAGPAHQLDAAEISVFGLMGLAGVLFIPVLARWVDRIGTNWIGLIGVGSVAAAWLLVGLLQTNCWALAAGGALLNFGVAASQVGNQASIFTLCQGARSRLAAVYAMGLFTGGMVAAPLATALWARLGWTSVCVVGAGLAVLTVFLQVARFGRHGQATRDLLRESVNT